MADVSIYCMDIRAFGKGFCEFYQQSIGMGVEFHKGKVAKITEKENGNLILRYEDIEEGKIKEVEHDLVVLSIGILPNPDAKMLFNDPVIESDEFSFIKQSDELVCPPKTNIEGVFVAGTSSGPMDIPDSILSAGAASACSASYIRN